MSACRIRLRQKVGTSWKRASFVAEPRPVYSLADHKQRHRAAEQGSHSVQNFDGARDGAIASLKLRSQIPASSAIALPGESASHGCQLTLLAISMQSEINVAGNSCEFSKTYDLIRIAGSNPVLSATKSAVLGRSAVSARLCLRTRERPRVFSSARLPKYLAETELAPNSRACRRIVSVVVAECTIKPWDQTPTA